MGRSGLIAKNPRRRYFTSVFGAGTESGLAQLATPRTEVVREPWGGYVPDIDPALLRLSDAQITLGVVARGGILGPDDGWDRLDPDNLPLAGGGISAISAANPAVITCVENHDVPAATTFEVVITGSDSGTSVDGTHTATRTAVNQFSVPVDNGGGPAGTTGRWRHIDPDTGGGEPITGLIQFNTAGSIAAPNQVAITGTAETSGGTVIPGHVSQLVTGSWTLQPYDGIAGIAGNQPLEGAVGDLFDWAHFIPDGKVVFCNLADVVYMLPGNAASTYGPLMQLNHDFGNLGAPGAGNAYTFNARSCESFGERMVFLNTIEDTPGAGTAHPQRFRFGIIGPSTLVGGQPQMMAGQGSGFIDLHEFGGEGLRCETLGNLCACYFSDGVAFMRRTLNSSAPFTREYVTKRRGALGTFSVANIARGVHFIISTDGWFFLDATGRWTELGLMRTGGRVLRKWMDTFYALLNYEHRNRVVCEFDRLRRFVSIAFPSLLSADGSPDQVWHYDVDSDRVWTDSYHVNCWGQFDDIIAAGTAWQDMVGSWADQGPAAWRDFAGQTGLYRIIHGTETGEVFRHSSSLFTRDGSPTGMIYRSREVDFGLPPSAQLLSDKVWMSYVRVVPTGGGNPPAVTLGVSSQGTTQERTLNPLKGASNTNQTDFVSARTEGERLGIRFSSSAPTFVNGFQLGYVVEGTEPLKSRL